MSFTVGRLVGGVAAGVIFNTVINLAGVWFVVDVALRGVESSIANGLSTTGSRITDMSERITEVGNRVSEVDGKVFALQGAISQGFRDTRTDIQKASRFDPVAIPPEAFRIATKIENKVRLDAILNKERAIVFVPSPEAWGKFVVSNGTDGISSALEDANVVTEIVRQLTLPGLKFDELHKKAMEQNGTYNFTTAGGKQFTITYGDLTVLADENGTQAIIEGLSEEAGQVSVVNVSSTFDIGRF